jgi:hypothetical protein
MALISAWDNYYFQTEDDRFFKVVPFFRSFQLYENVEDDINTLILSGSLDECLEWLSKVGAVNYDPLAKYRD